MSAYPPHLSHIAADVHRLRGTNDLTAMFPGEKALAAVPWPRAPRLPDGHLFDRDAVAAEFGESLPAVALIDPESLWASQPSVTRAGVEYYTSPSWFRTGVTYADQRSEFNRLPVVEIRPHDVSVILNGHHRSCAALLSGARVLARIVSLVGEAIGSRIDLRLPSLVVGTWYEAEEADSVQDALEAIQDGVVVGVTDEAIANGVIASLAERYG